MLGRLVSFTRPLNALRSKAGFSIFRNPIRQKAGGIPEEVALARERSKTIQSIAARLKDRRTATEKTADVLVRWFGSIGSIALHGAVFIFWILANLGHIPGVTPFDPFPFIFLTMLVSLEAIFLSLFVLISQNRDARTSDLREEIDIQINMIAEEEITKIIRLLAYLMRHVGAPVERDPDLKRMMQPLNTEEIRKELERQLNLPHDKK